MSRDHQLVLINNGIRLEENPKPFECPTLCDICKRNKGTDGSEIPVASMHCIDCKENQCDDCSRAHKKQAMSEHKIVALDKSLMDPTNKSEPTNHLTLCDVGQQIEEKDENAVLAATMRCIDCKLNQCDECSRSHINDLESKGHQIVTIDDQLRKVWKQEMRGSHSEYQTILCDLCRENKKTGSREIPSSEICSSNFEENLHDDCSLVHKERDLSEKHPIADNEKIRNTFIDNKKMSERVKKATVCDACMKKGGKSINNGKAATKHCIECKENQCSACSRSHKRHKITKKHQIVDIEKQTNKITQETVSFNETQHSEKTSTCDKDISCGSSRSPQPNPEEINAIRRKEINNITRSTEGLLKNKVHSRIQKIIHKPEIQEQDLERFWPLALPYILQRIKMWNGDVLSSRNISSFILRMQNQTAASGMSSTTSKNEYLKVISEKFTGSPISRLDCLTYIINTADCIVRQDILLILSKFPMAIPYIVQDIHEDGKFIVMEPALQSIVIKWESNPGQIVENHFLSSPFRMMVAIRIGTNRIGKSTILNQLMRKPNMFSSKGEPGGDYGRPRTLNGAVEIIWLTQETCSDATWKETMCEYRKENNEEVAILANLHGESLQFQDTLKYLQRIACSFIVFLMPGFAKDQLRKLKDVTLDCEVIYVLVDPLENLNQEFPIIQTDSLVCDSTQDRIRHLIRESLNVPKKEKGSSAIHTQTKAPTMKRLLHPAHDCLNISNSHHLEKALKYAESVSCKKADQILNIVKEKGCLEAKRLLRNIGFCEIKPKKQNQRSLVILFLEILKLPEDKAIKSLSHLENQLSQLSAEESLTARCEVSCEKEKLRRLLKAPNMSKADFQTPQMEVELKKFQELREQHEAELQKIQDRLNSAMDKVENMNIGTEHFIRTLAVLFEKSFCMRDGQEFDSIRGVPNRFADLLMSGHAIELLNGDDGEIQMIWIKAIFHEISKKLPNLKIYVISIIGLQSSGKSTLLNALFSCRFAVSVGRCSRGLFMRMIFLEEEMRQSHGFDAIILIDTEGLASPEKMNDPKASHKDRLMATFAMGISNLTIVNILGEGMTEMTEVLQIAIVAMARLRSGHIKPDILMVQHLQERNLSKIDKAKGQFCEAINKAFELINKNDVEIGSASAECLDELTERIQSGDLFKHFGTFRDGSTVNSPPSEAYHEDVVGLYETLLNRAKVSNNKNTFERWSNHFESYWECVESENFALNFKNIKHITDFLYFGKKIAKVKELLDRAIRFHREIFLNNIKETVSTKVTGNRDTPTEPIRTKVLEEIQVELETIPYMCPEKCSKCDDFKNERDKLYSDTQDTEWGDDIKRSIEVYSGRLHERTLKILRQAFDGSVVKQGCFKEFSDLIATELKKALEWRPNGEFSAEEQKTIVFDIWNLLQGIANSKETAPDLTKRLNQALRREYVEPGIQPHLVEDLKTSITFDQLLNSKAIKSLLSKIPLICNIKSYKLDEEQLSHLVQALRQRLKAILQERRSDCFLIGIDFEESMVSEIKSKFPETIKYFEKQFDIELQDKFKYAILIYTIQLFRDTILHLQNLWDAHNNPTQILQLKRQDYIQEIETRLKSGFSFAGEGEIMATKLNKAIKEKAIQAGYDAQVQSVKDLIWTTNSENVRLYYFEQLAVEVRNGNKDRALRHFRSPKDSIEHWFRNEVDSLHSEENVWKQFESTWKQELDCILQETEMANSKEDIEKIVKEHIKNTDDQYYSKLDPKDNDYQALKDSMKLNLTNLYHMDQKKSIEFPLTSNHPEIEGRLGCTESCFCCGSLCWGSRDHHLEGEKNRKIQAHHSCHQPSGLKGTKNRNTCRLVSLPCHKYKDDIPVHFGEYDEIGILWSEAKKNHFSDWKFDAHYITKFDELMHWFFQELHRDIAFIQSSLPAEESDLKKNKCKGLKLDDILKVVRSKII